MAGVHAVLDAPEEAVPSPTSTLPPESPAEDVGGEPRAVVLRGTNVEAEDEHHPADDLDPAEGYVLRIGEGLDLARGRVLRGAQVRAADVVVHDIHRSQGAVLACPHGGALVPKGDAFTPNGVELLDIAELMVQAQLAPPALTLEQISLFGTTTQPERRVGFAATRSQQAWRLELTHVGSEPIATDRRIQLRAVAVERGDLSVSLDLEAPKPVDLPRSDRLDHVLRLARQLRRDAPFISWLGRNLGRAGFALDTLPGGLRLGHDTGAVFTSLLDRKIRTKSQAGIHALDGTGPNADIELAHHSALRVVGDLEGRVVLADHGSLIVEGDLLGHVSCGSWGKVIVFGDLRGELTIGSHAQVFLLGELRRPTTLTDTHARIFVDQHLSEGDVQRLFPKPERFTRLYIPSGGWPEGTHKDAAGFSEVIVGGDRWATIRLR